MALRNTTPGMLGRIDSIDVAVAHGATLNSSSSSSDAKQSRVKQRVNAYRHALQRLESNSSAAGFKVNGAVRSSNMFSPSVAKGATVEVSTSSSFEEDADSEEDEAADSEGSSAPAIAMPKVATRKSLTLVNNSAHQHALASKNNWVRLSGSLDRKELERLRFSKHQRKPLTEARDSLLLLKKGESEGAAKMVEEAAETKAKAEQVPMMPKLSTRNSFSLVKRTDSSRFSVGTGAVVSKSMLPIESSIDDDEDDEASEPETFNDDPIFVGGDEGRDSYEWDDPMLDEGFDLGLLGLSAPPKPAPAVEKSAEAAAASGDDTLTASALQGLQCEWDEWWSWYDEALQYSEAV
jgi:hypothetical protein